jgi:N-methylhydantoinase B
MTDPITLEVIYHRLKSICDEMEDTLLKSSFSTIVKEGRDCSTALFDAQGQTVAQAMSIPIHLGTLMGSVPQILKVFPVSEAHEGDVFIANDPYSGGTHLPDITMVVPIIYQGEVVALSCSIVHHQDIGAMTPGVPTSATSIYQEGLNLPPVKFYDAGTPVKAIHDIIRKNVRTPDLVIGDLRAQLASGNVGKLRIREVCEEYGKKFFMDAINQLMDHSEALVRKELEKIPDGTYSFVNQMDNDGVDLEKRIKIQVKVTIKGSEFIADFSGTNPQVKGPFNSSISSTFSTICYVIMAITDPNIPTNAGCFRSITMKVPEGCLLNPSHPAALGARAATASATADTLLGALVKAAPNRIPAGSSTVLLIIYFGGMDPLTGEEFGTVEFAVGGMGGRPNKDGIDVIFSDVNNCLSIPVESHEMNFPLRVLRTGLYEGSGGAGEYRGGLGQAKVFEITRGSFSATFRGERHYTRPWGLFGGLPGYSSKGWIIRKNGEKEEIPSKRDLIVEAGDQIHLFTAGGGGYGDPLKRKEEFVLQDVLDRKVSVESADEDYGVVIDKDTMTVDLENTGELRKEKAKQRGPITWTYDWGPEQGRK